MRDPHATLREILYPHTVDPEQAARDRAARKFSASLPESVREHPTAKGIVAVIQTGTVLDDGQWKRLRSEMEQIVREARK